MFPLANRTIDHGVNEHFSCAKPTRGKLTKQKLIKIKQNIQTEPQLHVYGPIYTIKLP